MCIFAFSSSLNFFFVGFHSYCLFVHFFLLQSVSKKEKVCALLQYFVILVLKASVCVCIYTVYNAPNVCGGHSPGHEYEYSVVTAIINQKQLKQRHEIERKILR